MNILKHDATRSTILILSLLGLCMLAAASPPRAHAADLCAAALPLQPGSVARLPGGEKELHVRLELGAPGVVTLDAESRLRLTPCDAVAAEAILLQDSLGHLTFAVRRPGAWLVRVAAPELVTGFVEIRGEDLPTPHGVWTAFRRAGLSTKEEDHEVDPDPKTAAGTIFSTLRLAGGGRVVLIPGGAAFSAKEEDHEVDPDPKAAGAGVARRWSVRLSLAAALSAKEEDHEVDPDPKTLGADAPVRRIRFETAAGLTEPEIRDALAEWLAGWIGTAGPSAGDEGLRLLALTPR